MSGGLDEATGLAWAAVGGALHGWRADGSGASEHASQPLPPQPPNAPPPLCAAVPHAAGAGFTLLAALPDARALLVWRDAAARHEPPVRFDLHELPAALLAAPGVSGCVLTRHARRRAAGGVAPADSKAPRPLPASKP